MTWNFLKIILAILVFTPGPAWSGRDIDFTPYTNPPETATADGVHAAMNYVMSGSATADFHESFRYPLHIEMFKNGERLAFGWTPGAETAVANLEQLRRSWLKNGGKSGIDGVLSLSLIHTLSPPEKSDLFDRGLDSLYAYCTSTDRRVLIPASRWIVKNRNMGSMLRVLQDETACIPDARGVVSLKILRGDTIHWIRRENDRKPERLFRGDQTIPDDHVTPENIASFLTNMGGWIKRNTHEDGRLEYKYWPSRDQYSSSNNLIRQWMTTHAMALLARHENDSSLWGLWRKNTSYNIEKFYRSEGDYGYFLDEGEAKLGTNAAAAMALGEGAEKSHDDIYHNIIRGILRQRQPDGSFRTWFIPADQNDNQAFYPGESLVALALGAEQKRIALPDGIDIIRDYYMQWWRDNDRETAFIPWHTQAYYRLYHLTGDNKYRDDIFEMNDFLIGCQRLDDKREPDRNGEYSVPECRQYGPPHASSTAVYTEGLVYAYRMAAEMKDQKRMESYRRAIFAGLRSLMQLQVNQDDTWYMKNPDRALGGIRTTAYNNEIRCDNIQHAIAAATASWPIFFEKTP